jgi:dolichyl-phosphate beta-glucosyltransferase
MNDTGQNLDSGGRGARVELSLVLPVFNGEAYISASLDRAVAYLEAQLDSFEIVVVDDGSTDDTGSVVSGRRDDRLRLVTLDGNRGKYGAIKAGMACCTGGCRVFTDADLPYDLSALPHITALVNERGFHVVVGDRSLAESETELPTSLFRRITTRGYSTVVRLLVTGGLFDTQCGIKGFRDDVADALFPMLRNDGFSGDVELLYVALKYNLEIRRIPVLLKRAAPTTVRMAMDSVGMVLRTVGLRNRWVNGTYESDALRKISSQRYWRRAAAGSGSDAG